MKKDKKWFVDKWTKERDKTDVHDPMYHFINEFIADVKQLDEPEVLSQEWIRENQERKDIHFYVSVIKLQNLLVPKQEITFDQVHDKLREESILSEKSFDYYWNCINDNVEIDEPGNLLVPKQELPVIPKYVGDWITKYRKVFGLYPALKKLEDSPLIWERIYKWYRMNTYKFVNAYLTGEYEVEEEPLYYALIKGHELVNDYDIYWNCDMFDDDVFVIGLQPSHDNFLTEMTEQEWFKIGINDSNADFVKVEEVEE